VVKLNLFEPVDWTQYLPGRITPNMIELDGQIIRIVTGLSGVTYNAQLAPMKPTVLDDFLTAGWKGKIASTPYAAGLDVLLAEDVWGKQKTVTFVRALARQIAGVMRCGETERVATGEYLALVMDCTGQDALLWQEKGAPVAQLMPLDAAQQRYYYFAVPKNAQHPSAAKLFTIFLLTEEGQRLAYDTWKIDLHFMPGSKMGAMIADYQKRDVKFKEVTTRWWSEHPEIDATRSELIKILTTKE
jgi:iron(III) transport system substrate-binding protein